MYIYDVDTLALVNNSIWYLFHDFLAMMVFPSVTHIIFDMDGLILDTERLYSEANQQVLSKYGKEFTWEVKKAQMGRKKHEAVKILLDMLQLPLSFEEYSSQVDDLLTKLLPTAKLLPGAEKLIRHLHHRKIPIALCTGTAQEFYQLKTRNHSAVFNLFLHKVLCGDDPEVTHGKPHPECFQVCARRFQPEPESPEKILVFEDAPNGVEAAVAAHMQVVMVPDSRVDKTVRDMASLCLDSLEEFDPVIFGLPAFNESS